MIELISALALVVVAVHLLTRPRWDKKVVRRVLLFNTYEEAVSYALREGTAVIVNYDARLDKYVVELPDARP